MPGGRREPFISFMQSLIHERGKGREGMRERDEEKCRPENLACPSTTVYEGVCFLASSHSLGVIIFFNTSPTCQEQGGLLLLF